jgi:hypothetical protein
MGEAYGSILHPAGSSEFKLSPDFEVVKMATASTHRLRQCLTMTVLSLEAAKICALAGARRWLRKR